MTKTVMVINDLSSFGNCSLTAAIAVLSAMGHRPCPLPTAVLSAQSEFPAYYAEELTDAMPRFADAWAANREQFDGIFTGYFAGERQLDYALDCLSRFRGDGTPVLVDPVMGDSGTLYPAYDRAACEKMKRLAACADVLTPNLTELCILSGADYGALTARCRDEDYLPRIAALAQPLAEGRSVVVTGVSVGEDICNLAIEGGKTEIIRSKRLEGRFSGTGDLFSAVAGGCMLHGCQLADSVRIAARFVSQAVADTLKEPHIPRYGVNYEKFLYTLHEVNQHANR